MKKQLLSAQRIPQLLYDQLTDSFRIDETSRVVHVTGFAGNVQIVDLLFTHDCVMSIGLHIDNDNSCTFILFPDNSPENRKDRPKKTHLPAILKVIGGKTDGPLRDRVFDDVLIIRQKELKITESAVLELFAISVVFSHLFHLSKGMKLGVKKSIPFSEVPALSPIKIPSTGAY